MTAVIISSTTRSASFNDSPSTTIWSRIVLSLLASSSRDWTRIAPRTSAMMAGNRRTAATLVRRLQLSIRHLVESRFSGSGAPLPIRLSA